MIKSLTKHDNCFDDYQYLHSTLSAFSQGTVLSQLSMLFFQRIRFLQHPYYIRQASRLQVKQIYVAASRAKHAKIRQNVSSFKTLVGINLLPLYSPQGIFRWNFDLKKKHHSGCEVSPQPTIVIIAHGFSRASPKEQHERYSTGKKRNEHSGFLKHDTTQFLHPRALAQMQFQIVSNPVCINIILYLYYLYI